MGSTGRSVILMRVLLASALVIFCGHAVMAQQHPPLMQDRGDIRPVMERIVHSFQYPNDADRPESGLVSDRFGNLYGTTSGGGTSYSGGTVFELSFHGQWTETILHSFAGYPTDGLNPWGGVVFDKSGNLFGVTLQGGDAVCDCGTIYELARQPNGMWLETVVYSFQGGADGASPSGPLAIDAAGNLYGTTSLAGGGACDTYFGVGCGTVYELSPQGAQGWVMTLLHTFQPDGQDGNYAQTGVTLDSAGNLYGTTIVGGSNPVCGTVPVGCGTVFQLKQQVGGDWAETIVHSFNGTDGAWPLGVIALDSAGNIYGTTSGGGTGRCVHRCGTVFEIMPQPGGLWNETVIHDFVDGSMDGQYPYGGLSLGPDGRIFGTTTVGGSGNCDIFGQPGCGTVFMLSPKSEGRWGETILYDFQGPPNDGSYPAHDLLEKDGALFGTTTFGGDNSECEFSCGTVFQITP